MANEESQRQMPRGRLASGRDRKPPEPLLVRARDVARVAASVAGVMRAVIADKDHEPATSEDPADRSYEMASHMHGSVFTDPPVKSTVRAADELPGQRQVR